MPEHSPAPTPHRAVYGFAFYLLFFTLVVIYVLWALLPTEKMGLTYLPDRYFALCLPIVVLVGLTLFVFIIYPAINTSLTPEVDDLATVIDSASVRRICGYPTDKVLNTWDHLKCPETPTHNKLHERKVLSNPPPCKTCQRIHQPTNMKPIATLRFMDLAEVNECIFGS